MLHLGRFEIWVSLGIATIKAALVIFFFMHLLYDKPFNKMLFFAAFLFVALFIGITLMDSNQYQGDIRAYQSEQIDDGK
jgi:cytochrome c oxidase subunit 4